MKRSSIILIVGICTLSSALCRAESAAIPHNFQTLYSLGNLTFPGAPSDFSYATTDLVTYTGSASGGFDKYGGTTWCVSLPVRNSVMQTSPAVENLTRLTLTHTYGSSPNWIQVWISTDNSSWTNISASVTYGSSTIDAPMPTKGNYYIKLINKGTSSPAQPVNILSFRYVYEPCHCLRVVSE